jgi:hypothetical protein
LKEWKESLSSEKEYYQGEENSASAQQSFTEHKNHIKELKEAIKYLNDKK